MDRLTTSEPLIYSSDPFIAEWAKHRLAAAEAEYVAMYGEAAS